MKVDNVARVSNAIKSKAMTQEEIATELQLTVSAVYKILKNKVTDVAVDGKGKHKKYSISTTQDTV